MLRKLITTGVMALGLYAMASATAEARGGFGGGGFHGGFGGFRGGGSSGGFHRGSGGFHPGFGGRVRHRVAGRPHHRVWGRGWPWWGYGAGSLVYADPYYPYDSSYSPNYEDSY